MGRAVGSGALRGMASAAVYCVVVAVFFALSDGTGTTVTDALSVFTVLLVYASLVALPVGLVVGGLLGGVLRHDPSRARRSLLAGVVVLGFPAIALAVFGWQGVGLLFAFGIAPGVTGAVGLLWHARALERSGAEPVR